MNAVTSLIAANRSDKSVGAQSQLRRFVAKPKGRNDLIARLFGRKLSALGIFEIRDNNAAFGDAALQCDVFGFVQWVQSAVVGGDWAEHCETVLWTTHCGSAIEVSTDQWSEIAIDTEAREKRNEERQIKIN